MKVIVSFFLVCIFAAGTFFLGSYWGQKKIRNSPKYELTTQLEIQVSPDRRGVLPAGVVLYRTGDKLDPPSFFMYVNTKALNTLKPVEGEEGVTIPVDAYLPDE